MKDRLKKNKQFWCETISRTRNNTILETIEYGYKITFPYHTKKRGFLSKQSIGIRKKEKKTRIEHAILKMLKSVTIIETRTTPHVINPLLVSSNSIGKKRLILDL